MKYRIEWVDRSEGIKSLKGMISLRLFCEPIGNWILCDIKASPALTLDARKKSAEDLAKRSIDVAVRAVSHVTARIDLRCEK